MPKPYDDAMKKLVDRRPQDFLWWFFRNAQFVKQLPYERRFAVFSDFLRDSPVYQEVLEEGMEKGLEQGLATGLQKGLQAGELHAQRQTLREVVNERFPELGYLAKEQAEATDDAELLRRMTVKISVAPSPGDAEQYLLAISRRDKKN